MKFYLHDSIVGYNIRFLILFSLKRLPYKITLINVEQLTNFIKRAFSFLTCHSFIENLHSPKPNHCKLETDFNTFLGQRKPTSLLKHLSNASKLKRLPV